MRIRGWGEGSVTINISSRLQVKPYSGEAQTPPIDTESSSPSYLIDNMSGRVALDVEWQAKDGNLDRDIATYRSLHDVGLIDAAVLITMGRKELRSFGDRGNRAEAGKRSLPRRR